jgi:hypothetical protein
MATSVWNPATAPVERSPRRYFRDPRLLQDDAWRIAIRLSVKADAYRLFQALTTPEYLETWVSLPGDGANSYIAAWKEPDGFRIDHYRHGHRDLVIRCTYQMCRRRKMLFCFRLTGELTPPESLVLIRLSGNFGSTMLELHHRGVSASSYHAWQLEMWQLSLGRLASLF